MTNLSCLERRANVCKYVQNNMYKKFDNNILCTNFRFLNKTEYREPNIISTYNICDTIQTSETCVNLLAMLASAEVSLSVHIHKIYSHNGST